MQSHLVFHSAKSSIVFFMQRSAHDGVSDLKFQQLMAQQDMTCAISTTQRLYCWDSNSYGKLGTGSGDMFTQPTPVAGDVLFKAVVAGLNHTCGISTDNTTHCWGNNDGQPGSLRVIASPVPLLIKQP